MNDNKTNHKLCNLNITLVNMKKRKIDSNAVNCYIGAISSALLIITTLMAPSLQNEPIAKLSYGVIGISLIFIVVSFINITSGSRPVLQCNLNAIYDNNSLTTLLGITEKDLKSLRDNGLIGYSRYGDLYWYTQSDVNQFLSRCHNAPF